MNRLQETMSMITRLDRAWLDRAQARLDSLTKPLGSLGRLEELARQVVGITGSLDPQVWPGLVGVFAGDHGVVAQGVSPYPQEVTRQMVLNFLAGGAGINVLARHVGAQVWVVDVGVAGDISTTLPGFHQRKVAPGTADMTKGPAMTREQTLAALEVGIDLARRAWEDGFKSLATGEMGIGNTTPASALAAVFTGRKVAEVTGRGAGLDEAGWRNKVAVIEKALAVNRPDPADPLDALAKVGGLEIAAIAGFCLGGAALRLPVVVDGFISTAGAFVAARLCPAVTDYLVSAHKSVEIGHACLLQGLGLKPLVDLDLRLGEGTGAALGLNLLAASVKILTEMATFASAGVSEKNA